MTIQMAYTQPELDSRLDQVRTCQRNGNPESVTFRKLRTIGTKVKDVWFWGVNMEESLWVCCVFEDVDFTGAMTKNAYFNQCQFINCKDENRLTRT